MSTQDDTDDTDASLDRATEQDQQRKVPRRHFVSPLDYPGTKPHLYKKIAQYIDPFVPADCTYVDVNLGGGSTLCGFESYFHANRIIGNDINEELLTVWRCILDKRMSAELGKMVQKTPASLAEWHRATDLRQKHEATLLERAFAYLYLGKTSYRAIVGERPHGGFIETEVSKERIAREYEPDEISQHIQDLHDALWNRLTLTNLDHKAVIREYDLPNHVLCVDPPYMGTEDMYADQMEEEQAHENLAKELRAVKNAFVVLTYNDCEKIRELYLGCPIHRIEGKVSVRDEGTLPRIHTPQVLILINAKEQPARKNRPSPLPNPHLTDEEKTAMRSVLAKQDAIVAKGSRAFVNVGEALENIRTNRIYSVDHFTFAEYVNAKGMDLGTAYAKIKAAKAYRNVCKLDVKCHPQCKHQLDPLLTLPPEEQRKAWLEAIKLANNEHLVARHVKAAVDAMRKTGAKRKRPTLRLLSDAIKKCLNLPADTAVKFAQLNCVLNTGSKDGICTSADLVAWFDSIAEIMRQNLSPDVSNPQIDRLRYALDARLAGRLTRIKDGSEVVPEEAIPPTLFRVVKAAQLARDVECIRQHNPDTVARKKSKRRLVKHLPS